MSKKKNPQRWPGMSAKQLDHVGEYLRDIADLVGLRDWTFSLQHQPVETQSGGEDALARVDRTKDRRHACIWITRTWRQQPREQRRMVVVHELVHLHTWDITAPLHDGSDTVLWRQLGEHTAEGLRERMRSAEEQAVDAITVAWAYRLPLPPK